MNDTHSNQGDANVAKKAGRQCSALFPGMLNMITNSGLDPEQLTGIVNTATGRGQLTTGEQTDLLRRIHNKTSNGNTTQDLATQNCRNTEHRQKRRKRSRDDHFNGSEGRIRSQVMRSHAVSNIRDTGPLGVKDLRFHKQDVRITLEASTGTGTIFGSRLKFSGPGRR